MRNLEATRYVSTPPSPLLAGAATCFCVDGDEGVWVASTAGLCRISSNLEVSVEFPLVDGGHVSSDDYVIGVECVSGEYVCLATRSGDILFYNIETQHVESVGSVEGGLLGMAWSPDQELVVFTTAASSLLLMTHTLVDPASQSSDLVPVTEVPMCPSEFGQAEPVSVGWGKKSTQFHGSAGKQSAHQKPVQDSGSAHPWDDLRPRVSWPEEGEYFACSCIDTSSGGRRIRVWTREGTLFSTSEVTPGLEQCLHWRPNGSLIASSQCLPHTHQVVFFEKNGLRHGHFSLPPHPTWLNGKCEVREMCWNCDSSVLCLWLEERRTTAAATSPHPPPPQQSSIQLWVRGNYHWYLKQELFSPLTPDSAPSASLGAVQWDPVLPLRLHVFTSDGVYVCCEWRWCVSKSSCLSRDNLCDVAVIDGDCLFLTPFRHVSTPPPMSTHTLSLSSPILTVTHAPPPLVNDFLVVMATAEVAVFSYSHVEGREEKNLFPLSSPKLIGLARLPGATSLLVRQLTWVRAESLVGVVWDAGSARDSVVEFQLTVDMETGSVEVGESHSHVVPPPHTSLISLTSHPDTGSTVAQTTDGTIFQITPECLLPWKLSNGLTLKFPEGPCDHISIATLHGRECVVGLNEFRRTLYVDDCKVATGVTTFDLHDEFLIYTTDSHECHFLRTPSSVVANPDPSDGSHLVEEGKRRVERGSKIVAVVPHNSKLVLQMPRGNLETIYPRPLVLSSVRRCLDNGRYGDAFLSMRTNRINLNLICDHNPQAFLENVKEFVRQLDSVTHINLFLTQLREEDTSKTMYPLPPGKEGEGGEGKREGGKVDRICDAVRKVLVDLNENKYLLSIITSHVKKSEPELETVLLRIRHLSLEEEREGERMTEKRKEGEKKEEKGGLERAEKGGHDAQNKAGKRVSSEEALKYVLFLVDVNRLYNVALGMYDFQLVLMVAEKSQKDPKEYLPFLNELRRLPDSYRKYKIDVHLRRYHKALHHISQCGPEKFDECLALIKEHSLYKHALEIFCNRSSSEYKTIAQCYGEHLSQQKDHRSAAIVFYRCGCVAEAMESFEKAGDWQMTLALSAQLGHDKGQRSQLARKMAGSLRSQRNHLAAATVLLQYAEDVEEAMVTLLEGGLWAESLRVVYLHNRRDLIETHFRPQLIESHQDHMSLLPTLSTDLSRHSDRLVLVIELKQRKQEAILEGTYAADEKDADLFSDTSSVTGRSATTSLASSRMTGRSRKNRRKAAHKKWSLREGSSHEDLALMEAISDLCTTVDSLHDEVPSLVQMLLLYDHAQEARQLHSLFSDLLVLAKCAVEKAWPKQATPTTQSVPVTGPHASVNSMLASMATTTTPAAEQTNNGEEFPRPQLRDATQQLRLSLLL